jgi:ABC-type dipeptide/oligopeptide/nickel transport system permease component
MIKYIVRRLLGAIPVLFGLSIILFAFVHLLPGDPATAILGQHATPDRVAASTWVSTSLSGSSTCATSAASSRATSGRASSTTSRS